MRTVQFNGALSKLLSHILKCTRPKQSKTLTFLPVKRFFCSASTDHMTVLLDHLEASFSSRLEVRLDVPWI